MTTFSGTNDILIGRATLSAGSPSNGGDAELMFYDARLFSVHDPEVFKDVVGIRPARVIENTQYRPGPEVWLIQYIAGGFELTEVRGEELVTGVC